MSKITGAPGVNVLWLAGMARQSAAGMTVGLSAVIYAISYGAMLFSGPLAPYVGIGIAAAIVTAVVGAPFGLLSEERRFISGPDSSTTSVLAGLLATLSAMQFAGLRTFNLALATLFLTSVVCAVSFYALGRFKLAGLVRFMPFSVTAGFLASNGWLICSSGLDIIKGYTAEPKRTGRAAGAPVPARIGIGVGGFARPLRFGEEGVRSPFDSAGDVDSVTPDECGAGIWHLPRHSVQPRQLDVPRA